ncbi:MAG: hypothetical protein JJT77_04675 [Crocinitomicaceae bacterium]|nr:hypothetical protein [Crocinitomicaceae bacterium]
MKKRNLIYGLMLTLLTACGERLDETPITIQETNENSSEEPVGQIDLEAMKDWPSQTYRSDGYRPSAASEWIKVIYTPDGKLINTILYWNVNDETPIEMKLIESEFIEGEISGWSGKLKSPDGFFDYEFGVIADQFNLVFDDEGRMQEFYQELD